MTRIGLYIHVPYCLHKCGYCDFNSHPLRGGESETAAYHRALLREMRHYARLLGKNREVASLFLGGGTPTVLGGASLETILSTARDCFRFAGDAEITVETNPAASDGDTLARLRRAGFNRLSVGVQSFDPDELKRLDRVHSAEEAEETLRNARRAGFDNLSLDLMFALPGQSPAQWESNLLRALEFQPEHLSAYNLTIEPGTAFAGLHRAGKLQLPGEEIQLRLFRRTLRLLKSAGYRHYEISNYARPGRECRHNINYWQNGEYLGLGAGAASFLDGVRRKNHDSPALYIRHVESGNTAVETFEQPAGAQSMGETIMLGLRLRRGLRIPDFESRYGIRFRDMFGTAVDSLKNKKLVTLRGGRLALSQKGLFLADSVMLEFMP